MLTAQDYSVYLSVQVVLFLFGSAANLVVISIIWKHKGLHTFTNYFLVNLAFADFFTLLFGTATDATYAFVQELNAPALHKMVNTTNGSYVNEHTHASGTKVMFLMFYATCMFKTVSDLTLMCLAVGRYKALVKPLSTGQNILHRKSVIIMMWIVPPFSLMIEVLGWKVCEDSESNLTFYIRFSFSVLWLCVIDLAPSLIIIYCYGSIIKGIHFDKTLLAEGYAMNDTSKKLNTRIVYRLLLVSFLSVTSTIPGVSLYIYVIWTEKFETNTTDTAFLVLASVEKLVATLNPIIYSLQNSSFRNALRRIIERWECSIMGVQDNETGTGRYEQGMVQTHRGR